MARKFEREEKQRKGEGRTRGKLEKREGRKKRESQRGDRK